MALISKLVACLLPLSFAALTATGQQAGGLSFDGVDDYAQSLISALPQGNSARTIEMWYKQGGTTGCIFNWGASTTNNRFGLINGGGTMYVVGENNDYATGIVIGSGWHHLAVSYDVTTLRVYRDGLLVASQNKSSSPYNTTGNTYRIGKRLDPLGAEQDGGTIDELRIWNVARTQAQIQAAMNGELSGNEANLVAYYNFNQGIENGTNTGLNCLLERNGNATSGILYNFALTGTTSNWTTGQFSVTPPAATVAPGNASSTQTVSGSTNFNTSCNVISNVTPSGANQVSGQVTTRVWVDGSVPTFNGQPYVQRRYDIEPATNANTATATVTLYYTQAEFNAYNAAANTPLDLPTGPSDAAGKAAMRFTQYHGSTSTGLPGSYTYSGPYSARVVIDPADNNIVWNATSTRWEVTFDVTGFSGFFVYAANNAVALPIKLKSFTAQQAGNATNRLDWAVAGENTALRFDVEHSRDGKSFNRIGTVAGKGESADYTFNHAAVSGNNFYRLKMTDATGTTYSGTVVLNGRSEGAVSVSPVPSEEALTITNTDATLNGLPATITDMQGRIVHRLQLSASQHIDLSAWTPGIYSLRLPNGGIVRLVKQ